MPLLNQPQTILVTGGNGFFGGHVSRRLHAEGHTVRVVDIRPHSYFPNFPDGMEVIVGDLRDPSVCKRVVSGVDIVMHFAATMGGMGTIHEANDFVIYKDNQRMMTNILASSVDSGVKNFFFASSACVYPESLQAAGNTDISLREGDVSMANLAPQGLYGLEKLQSEQLLQLAASHINGYIARFHNIYGPYGTWMGGREKVPAALLRKIIAGSLSQETPFPVEIWGDGCQRRSFCYIDDAVEGVLRLLGSNYHKPLNIGSDRAVSITELGHLAADSVDVASSQMSLVHVEGRPVGVASRNSNNERVSEVLGWTPAVPLEYGMRETGRWIRGEIDRLLSEKGEGERKKTLGRLQTSEMLDLRPSQRKVCAVLLPVTSRGLQQSTVPLECLDNLRIFAQSLLQTTAQDVGPDGKFAVKVYLAIDHDDQGLLQGSSNCAEEVLKDEGLADVTTLLCNFPKGHICSLWRSCARRAWDDGCDYFVLMGDDVVLQDNDWLSAVDAAFGDFSQSEKVPFGFGCVAFTDTSFPGMPTFPVLHRTHLDIFKGQVVPDVFINQDGDPFLYQLYRRFGCSKMISSSLRNGIGGGGAARYEKQHAKDWTFGTLDEATSVLESWLGPRSVAVRRLTVDVVIPCYRVNLEYLDRFLQLTTTESCSVMFIIIVDNPQSENIKALNKKYGHRPDVRIRVNRTNSGASASRNRGLQESSAEWAHFLDDDVQPEADLLVELEKIIRAHPNAAGFVGNALFPKAHSVYTTAIHLAGVTYFWDIAAKIKEDVPWGVTANLTVRRNVKDNVSYNLVFPKTGGGEDIDYCRQKRQYSKDHGREGFRAAPKVVVTHPYWNDGNRYYWRFYMWSKGDGALIKIYPDLTYVDYAPNSAELLLTSLLVAITEGAFSCFTDHWYPVDHSLALGCSMFAAVYIANIVHDGFRHL